MKKLFKIVAVSLIALSIVACTPKAPGNGDGDETAAQGITDTEVLIGNCAATSGAFAPVGVPFIAGIEAYAKYVNGLGGINGRQIKFTHTDDEFDPVKGKACLQNLVETEKVFAVVGHFGTPVVAATIEDLKEYGIPTVYFATGIGQLYNDKATGEDRILFPVQPIYQTEGQIMVTRGVGDFGAEKIGIIYTNDDAGKDMLDGARVKAKELNVELVEAQVAAGATDVSAAVTTIKEAGVDFIIGAAIQATIPTIIKALAEQNVNKDLITTYVNVAPAISAQVYDAIKGKFDVYGSGWVSFDAEQAEALALYQEHIGDDELAWNAYAITGWIAGHFFAAGLEKMGDKVATWDNYMDALEAAPIQNPFGGLIDFTDGKRMGTTVMNLSKIASAEAWEAVKPLQSIDEILGN